MKRIYNTLLSLAILLFAATSSYAQIDVHLKNGGILSFLKENVDSINHNTKGMTIFPKGANSILYDFDDIQKVAFSFTKSDELNGLTFRPQVSYYSHNAAKLSALNYNTYTIGSASADREEVGTHASHPRVSINGSKILDFYADYHISPSDADLSDITISDVAILFNDQEYIGSRSSTTRASAARLSAKAIDKSIPGVLRVILDGKPDGIKQIPEDNALTLFATEVRTKEGKTITSDYAAIYKTAGVRNFRLAHRKAADIPYTGIMNDDNAYMVNGEPCGSCPLSTNLGHLFAERKEAISALPQDTCDWNSSLDLRKLIEVHYRDLNDTHAILREDLLKNYGLKIKFELTGLFMGMNQTSESAYASIAEDGYTFRPQMPVYIDDSYQQGIQAAYGTTVQARSTIGRTPLIRVSLIDTTANNAVYDYGYIRIRISETIIPEPEPTFRLAHRYAADVPYTGIKNELDDIVNGESCGPCPLMNNLGHLFINEQDATNALPQDTCDWDSSLDLRKLVEVHYKNQDDVHAVMTEDILNSYGIKIKFELTDLFFGMNQTSESAYAAIAEDGYTFRPQSTDINGLQAVYGNPQSPATIGHTPLIRVSLVDATSNEVYDYGYIRIRISETAKIFTP